jgi:hypothetical protein
MPVGNLRMEILNLKLFALLLVDRGILVEEK